MTLIWLLIFVFLFGVDRGRRVRKRAFDTQRLMGDTIALRNGTYVSRLVRKHSTRYTGRIINKIKGK